MGELKINVWIIRFDKSIVWPDGLKSNLVSTVGSYEEAAKYAADLAEKYGLKVEAVV